MDKHVLLLKARAGLCIEIHTDFRQRSPGSWAVITRTRSVHKAGGWNQWLQSLLMVAQHIPCWPGWKSAFMKHNWIKKQMM